MANLQRHKRTSKQWRRRRSLDQRLERLRQCVDLTELIRADTDVRLHEVDGALVGHCPFHLGSDGNSLIVQAEARKFQCTICGFSGSIVGWMMYRHGLGFHEAIRELAAQAGLSELFESDSIACQIEHARITAVRERVARRCRDALSDSTVAVDYLYRVREFNRESVERFMLGWCAKERLPLGRRGRELWHAGVMMRLADGHYLSRFGQRVIFPIRALSGEMVGFGARSVVNTDRSKYLNSTTSRVFHKQDLLYGLYEALEEASGGATERLILVEGYTDVISLNQRGVLGAIATLGTAISANQLAEIFRHTDRLYVCLDRDLAGQNATFKALCQAVQVMDDEQSVVIVELDEGYDPDAYVREYGAARFENTLATATPIELWMHNYIAADVLSTARAIEERPTTLGSPPIIDIPKNHLGLLARYSVHARQVLDSTHSLVIERRLRNRFERTVGLEL